jgi:hypothetical protein
MHPGISRHTATALVLAACGTLAGAAHAQAGTATWSTFGSLTAVHQAAADLDGGGDYSASSAILRAGVLGDLGAGRRAGLVFNYDYTDYDFSAPAAFGGLAPWGAVQRYGVAAPLSYTRADGWSLGLTPSVDWIGENGADSGESLTWGAIATATRFFADGNRIGFGLAAFDRLDETRVFPLLLVDWRLSDRWRLGNPLPAGPTGPAGLELDYRLGDGWNLGLGAAWRSTRFRLSDSGPVPGGIAEEEGVPVFLRATRSFGPGATLYLYAGLVTSGRLSVEDASGQVQREVDFGTTPLFGATLSARF